MSCAAPRAANSAPSTAAAAAAAAGVAVAAAAASGESEGSHAAVARASDDFDDAASASGAPALKVGHGWLVHPVGSKWTRKRLCWTPWLHAAFCCSRVNLPQNALVENIVRKGSNSYYYAHTGALADSRPAIVYDSAPQLVRKEVVAAASDLLPVVPVTKYAWSDGKRGVSIYIDVPDAEAIPDEDFQVIGWEGWGGGGELSHSVLPKRVRVVRGKPARPGLRVLVFSVVPIPSSCGRQQVSSFSTD
jgi:hypothetical protein